MKIHHISILEDLPTRLRIMVDYDEPRFLIGPKRTQREAIVLKLGSTSSFRLQYNCIAWKDSGRSIPEEMGIPIARDLTTYLINLYTSRGAKQQQPPPPPRPVPQRATWTTFFAVSFSCNHDTLKKAYRQKVKETHPDKGGTKEAFQRVQQMYEQAKKDRNFK